MKIASSSVQLGAEISALVKNEKHESLTTWNRKQPHSTIRGNGDGSLRKAAEEQITAGKHGAVKLSLGHKASRPDAAQKVAEPASTRPDAVEDLKLDILKAMIEKLTGKKIEVVSPDELLSQSPEENGSKTAQGDASPAEEGGFGLIYDSYQSYYEYQSLDFSAAGSITTADGQQIDFSVSLSMTYEFYSEQHIQLRAGEALKDPLAVNFSGVAAELTHKEFSFDIDVDGRNEQIPFLQPGSGFLALDRNGDGIINNGSELFGALSGDGFEELARYDEDGNNFIDENDSIFKKLRIWSREPDGSNRLFALGKAGIGAIFLGKADSPFDMKDSANNLLGKIRSTGFFLREDGSAGTVQQIDLKV